MMYIDHLNECNLAVREASREARKPMVSHIGMSTLVGSLFRSALTLVVRIHPPDVLPNLDFEGRIHPPDVLPNLDFEGQSTSASLGIRLGCLQSS